MSTSRPLSVALLGPDIDHRKSLEAMLAGRVSKLTWFPDSMSLLQGRRFSFSQRILRAFDQLTHTRDRDFVDKVCRHLDENQTDVIVAYWGTNPLADLVAIKRLRPHIKTVLMVLCFPLALDSRGLKRQCWMMRHVAPHLTGILYSNTVMQDYFHCQVLGERNKHLQELVLKPCWPRNYQPLAERSEQTLEHPNLIYVGRTDLSHRTVHAADDLRPLMTEILDNHIELHHARSQETSDGHPFRRPFEPLGQNELVSKMASYDASLIAYNAAACERTERLKLTVPDRLITSVAAGVPIAIPSVGYEGAKQYLADYPAVLEFENVPDLWRQLADRERLQALHDAARQARRLYCAEAQGDGLVQFLESLVATEEYFYPSQHTSVPDRTKEQYPHV